ncbi:MAG: hypothetical protein JWM47_1236 [Acidimicrobiales bacterium]|nr:hypothetical protein [Acidimicrobiales bacterium]
MDKGSDGPHGDAAERRRALAGAIRQSRGLMTQAEVGVAVGRPQSCVSVWESGGIEIGVDRIFELEELFDLRHGFLLEAGGYVGPAQPVWWMRSEVATPDAVRNPAADALGMMNDFPERVTGWLNESGPLVEAAAVLRERGKESVALTFLLDVGELMHLRLAWEI